MGFPLMRVASARAPRSHRQAHGYASGPGLALAAVPGSERLGSGFWVSGLAVRTRVPAALQVRVRGAAGWRRGRGRRT